MCNVLKLEAWFRTMAQMEQIKHNDVQCHAAIAICMKTFIIIVVVFDISEILLVLNNTYIHIANSLEYISP